MALLRRALRAISRFQQSVKHVFPLTAFSLCFVQHLKTKLVVLELLQLELRRIDREIRQAKNEGDLARQDSLAGARQDVRRELDAVMGQTA